MNMVALVGNVASKPEMKQTSSGKACCTFRLAVSRIGSDQADFLTIVTWERQAEVCSEFIDIGRRIGVEGRLRHTTWKAEDESPRSRVEVVASRVDLIGPRVHRDRDEPAHTHPAEESADVLVAATADPDEHDDVFGFDSNSVSDVFERVAEPV